jgi:hypothetical protein
MRKIVPFLIALLTFTGCLAPKSFLEPKYRGIGYQDLKVPVAPIPIELTVIGQTNGDPNPRAALYWRRQVIRVLSASRVFSFPAAPGATAKLTVTFNNVGSRSGAAGKGFVTGLTFGAVGSLVTDGYLMTVEYSLPGQPTLTRTYQHAIYTTIGNATPPPGIEPVSLAEAPSLVAEDMLLHFVKDLQVGNFSLPPP